MSKDTVLEAAAEEVTGAVCGLPPGAVAASKVAIGAVRSDDEDDE